MSAIRWWTDLSPLMRATAFMILCAGFTAVQYGLIRIVSATLSPFEIVFFRNLIGFVLILPFLGGLRPSRWRIRRPGRLVITSAGLLVAMLCTFFAVAELPLAEITALGFTQPLFVTLGAALVLGEIVRARRWMALLMGFAGVLIVLRPGAEAVSPYALLMILSAMSMAAVTLLVKRLSATESGSAIVLYQSFFVTLLSLPLAVLYWRTPSLETVPYLLLLGVVGTMAWLTYIRGLALADASALMPVNYVKLPLAALVAYLFFAEVPTVWTWLGGTVIFGSTAYITHREAQAAAVLRAAAAKP